MAPAALSIATLYCLSCCEWRQNFPLDLHIIRLPLQKPPSAFSISIRSFNSNRRQRLSSPLHVFSAIQIEQAILHVRVNRSLLQLFYYDIKVRIFNHYYPLSNIESALNWKLVSVSSIHEWPSSHKRRYPQALSFRSLEQHHPESNLFKFFESAHFNCQRNKGKRPKAKKITHWATTR